MPCQFLLSLATVSKVRFLKRSCCVPPTFWEGFSSATSRCSSSFVLFTSSALPFCLLRPNRNAIIAPLEGFENVECRNQSFGRGVQGSTFPVSLVARCSPAKTNDFPLGGVEVRRPIGQRIGSCFSRSRCAGNLIIAGKVTEPSSHASGAKLRRWFTRKRILAALGTKASRHPESFTIHASKKS